MARSTELVAHVATYLGVNKALLLVQGKGAVALNYHGVVPEEYLESPFTYGNAVGLREFGRQMIEVSRSFQPMTMAEFQAWKAGNKVCRRRPVLVTFDDGYRNNFTYAAPILERCGVPAVFNVATGYVGSRRILWLDEIHWRVVNWRRDTLPVADSMTEVDTPKAEKPRRRLAAAMREMCKRIPHATAVAYLERLRKEEAPMPPGELYEFLSWDEVRKLRTRGFEIGSHTVEHPVLSRLPAERLAIELRESKRTIETETGVTCSYFAYPNGSRADISGEVVKATREAGYTMAFTVMGHGVSIEDDPLLLDRVYIPEGTSPSHFDSRISGLFGMLRSVTPERVLRSRLVY
jgi:peptidoglycan/xylan/chitin deacetylase (PgdA/CDA1 family)